MKNITFLYILVIAFLNAGISAMAQQPGGVPGSIVWLKADAGVTGNPTVTQWGDQSGNSMNGTAINGPTLTTDANNFNPAITFDRTNSAYIDLPDGFADFTGGLSAYVVAKPTNKGSYERFFDFGIGQANANILMYRYGTGSNLMYSVLYGATPDAVTVFNGIVDGSNSIYSVTQAGGTSGAKVVPSIFISGQDKNNTDDTYIPQNVTRVDNFIGKSNWGVIDDYYSGEFSEVIFYKTENSPTDRKKIESYLALKYGLTLDNSVASYLNSSGTAVYTYTGGYENDVVGIAYDLAGGLDQRVSKSEKAGTILTLATDADFTNVNGGTRTQLINGQYLVMANNGGATATQTTEMDASIYLSRIGREWRAENTGNVGAIHLKFNGFDDSYVLISDADGNFSSGATVVGVLNASGEINTTITDGMYYTLGTIPSPGGVTGAALWVSGDKGTSTTVDGATITTWNNNYGTDNDASGTGTPTYENDAASLYNFNPTVNFDASSNEYFAVNSDGPAGGTEGFQYFMVMNPNSATTMNLVPGLSAGSSALILNAGKPAVHKNGIGDVVTSSTTVTASKSQIVSAGRTGNSFNVGINGLTTATSVNAIGFNAASQYAISGPGTGFLGSIGEVIIYKGAITPPEEDKINSYLAIKYGITLDQTTAQDYVARDGSKLWDKDTAASYKHDIFGIAKDLNSALNQQISKSINSDAFFILSTDTNFTNTNGTHTDTLENLEAVMLSNNNGSFSRQTTEICQCAGHERIGREWLMQVSGTTPDVNLAFDKADLTVSENEEVYLLISTTGNFSNNLLSFHKMELNANDKYTTVLPTNTDNVYLTIGIVDKNKTRLRHGKRFIFQQLLKPVDNE